MALYSGFYVKILENICGYVLRFQTKKEFSNNLIVPKNLEEETLWVFWNFSMLQNIEKFEAGTLWRQKIEKKSHSAEKKIKWWTL